MPEIRTIFDKIRLIWLDIFSPDRARRLRKLRFFRYFRSFDEEIFRQARKDAVQDVQDIEPDREIDRLEIYEKDLR